MVSITQDVWWLYATYVLQFGYMTMKSQRRKTSNTKDFGYFRDKILRGWKDISENAEMFPRTCVGNVSFQ